MTTPLFNIWLDRIFPGLNKGRSVDELNATGYRGYPAFGPHVQKITPFHEGVLAAFMRRLPPEKRSDFPRYLAHHFLPETARPSAFSLLAVTGARLPSDGFSLVDSLDPYSTSVDAIVEIVGARHHFQGLRKAQAGDPIQLLPEPNNVFDSHAVMVYCRGELIGYVGRHQAQTVGTWIKGPHCLQCWLARLNGTESSPRVFAFVRLRPQSMCNAA